MMSEPDPKPANKPARTWMIKIELLVLVVLIALLCIQMQQASEATSLSSAYRFVDPIVSVRTKILERYVVKPEETTIDAMRSNAIGAMVDALGDQHSVYIKPDNSRDFNQNTRGSLVGIGVTISANEDGVKIVSPFPNSPALKAGLQANDLIVAIDGNSTKGFTMENVRKLILGKKGTKVTLGIKRAGEKEILQIQVMRDTVLIPRVKGWEHDNQGKWDYMMDPALGIGYIRIKQFSEPTAREFEDALQSIVDNGGKGLILDLRNNPGGVLNVAIDIAEMFIDEGTIVSTQGRVTGRHRHLAKAETTITDMPVVVLVNEHSASASEILAGAIKYNDRGIILGTRTTGKGSVQEVIQLGHKKEEGLLKLTVSYYYLPNDQNIHRRPGATKWGVDPNDGYYVRMTEKQNLEATRWRNMADTILANEEANDHIPEKFTAKWISQTMFDPQLAAAYLAMQAKITNGAFTKTGDLLESMNENIVHLEKLKAQRTELVERIREINEEINRMNLKENATTQPAINE